MTLSDNILSLSPVKLTLDFYPIMLYDHRMKTERYWQLYFHHLDAVIVPHFGERVRVGQYTGTVCGGDEDGGLTMTIDGDHKFLMTTWTPDVEILNA